jgi:elongation factor Ts
MSNIEMIKELRVLTSAGMKDCKDALEEANWDLQKAVDVIKTKGQNVAVNNKIAAEGLVRTYLHPNQNTLAMIEVNCITDFVAKSKEFKDFCDLVCGCLCVDASINVSWNPQDDDLVESARKNLVAITRENIVVRRWWTEQAFAEGCKVFSYVHPNINEGKIGVILTTLISNPELTNNPDFVKLGEELAMQIAAMNPLAISTDKLDPNTVERQLAIFEAQVKALNKPAQASAKIVEGKMNKWYTEVCLLNQESVIYPKTSIKQLISNLETKLNSKIELINYIKCVVGEGMEKPVNDFAEEAVNMANG